MTAYGDDVPLVDVVGADGNRSRGHIALGGPTGPALASFCDVGPVLHFWAHMSVELDPAAARNLAAELTTWADRKECHAEQAAS